MARKMERPKKVREGAGGEVRGDDDGSLSKKTFKWEEPEDPKTTWAFILKPRPLDAPWMYTMINGGLWFPFNHKAGLKAIETFAIGCQLPKHARHQPSATDSGRRTIVYPDDGGSILAHSIIFPDGRLWEATNRTLNKVYEPWKGYDQQPKG